MNEVNRDTPFFSVITVCLNSQKTIQSCIESVRAQTVSCFEHIVIDGQSNDCTLSILKQHSHPKLTWTSESDSGIADAMNKGIKKSRGEWLLFLQADDYLASNDSLQKVKNSIDKNSPINAYQVLVAENNRRRVFAPTRTPLRCLFKSPYPHQGAIINQSLFQSIGSYDCTFKIAMDYDWFIRSYHKKVRVKTHDFPIAIMNSGGVSSLQDWKSLKQRFLEEKRVHFKNARNMPLTPMYQIYWSVYFPYRKFLYTFRKKEH
ncbi:glycosyltransferase [Puniceicoccaceae bacterium K14]|nr:glycosyltransferase [Puniceicoccaceae bacterium K14]